MNVTPIKIIIALVILAGFGLFAINNVRLGSQPAIVNTSQDGKNSSSEPQKTELKVGDTAPDFTVTDVNGQTFSLSSQSKPVAIFFFAGWCGLCVPESRAWMKISQENPEKFVPVIIDIQKGETNEDIKRFMEAVALRSEKAIWALDTDNLVGKYNVKRLDVTYILDANKKILYKDEFPTSEETLREELKKGGII